jgi:hypothetical protein
MTADWNCKDGAIHTPQDTLGRAPAQRIKKVHMPLGRQHHQVGTPMGFFIENLIHDVTPSHHGFTGPTSVFRQVNFWRCSRTAHVNQAKFPAAQPSPRASSKAFLRAVCGWGS